MVADNHSVSNSGDGQRNLNHAKVYVTKYHHAVWPTQYTGNKDDCLVLNADQFRPNDFYQYAAGTLVDGSLIPGEWFFEILFGFSSFFLAFCISFD